MSSRGDRGRVVVISQPMLFPWVGMYEQLRLADIFINLDNVQFSKGSFTNRVQIKMSGGAKWMTVPLQDIHLGQLIREVKIDDRKDWRRSHLDLLRQSYSKAPFLGEMLEIVGEVYSARHENLGELAYASFRETAQFLGLDRGRVFRNAEDTPTNRQSSERVLDICRMNGASRYVTGLGARNYLDHALFEANGIRVEYMGYQKTPYRQCHGEFTPFVSILDLIANEGKDGLRYINSPSIYWKNFFETHD